MISYEWTVCLQDVTGTEQKIRELQESKDSLSNSIGQQKKRIMELRARNYAHDHEIVKLEDDKDRVRSTVCSALQHIHTCHMLHIVL